MIYNPFNHLIGKTIDEAKDILKEVKMFIRITKADGQNYFGTCDVRMDRLNVEVENNIITKIGGIG